jgi:hypothetical protein
MEIKKIDDLGKELDFTIVSEEWNRYNLSDGSVLKIRPIVVKIFETEQKTPTGEPVFGFASLNVASVTVPDELKKPSKGEENIETPVEFEPVKEIWNTFTLEERFNLKVKLVVSRVTRTSKVNQFGEPIYFVKSNNISDAESIKS